LYPVIYLDALVVKVKDAAHVRNKAAHLAVGVDVDGIKHVLGIWVQTSEGAKFWAGVCAELANRGIKDVLIVCCDGLTGFPEAIEATWPHSTIQTCVVHLIRAAMRFVNWQRQQECRGRVETGRNRDKPNILGQPHGLGVAQADSATPSGQPGAPGGFVTNSTLRRQSAWWSG
jgi:transposase-like protein